MVAMTMARPRLRLLRARPAGLQVERRRSAFHEDARADEDGFGTELHHHGGVSGRAMPPAEKFGTGNFPALATMRTNS